MICRKYDNLEQRIMSGCLNMLPGFVPKKDGEVSISEQKEFHDLMGALYRLLFQDPSLLVPALHEDDAFPTRY